MTVKARRVSFCLCRKYTISDFRGVSFSVSFPVPAIRLRSAAAAGAAWARRRGGGRTSQPLEHCAVGSAFPVSACRRSLPFVFPSFLAFSGAAFRLWALFLRSDLVNVLQGVSAAFAVLVWLFIVIYRMCA